VSRSCTTRPRSRSASAGPAEQPPAGEAVQAPRAGADRGSVLPTGRTSTSTPTQLGPPAVTRLFPQRHPTILLALAAGLLSSMFDGISRSGGRWRRWGPFGPVVTSNRPVEPRKRRRGKHHFRWRCTRRTTKIADVAHPDDHHDDRRRRPADCRPALSAPRPSMFGAIPLRRSPGWSTVTPIARRGDRDHD
jgi:hypothetical protein